MFKKIICIVLAVAMTTTLTGCWDYRRLSELNIVAGVAVDRDNQSGDYQLAFEIFDLEESSKSTGIKAEIIDGAGTTLFEAVRNAKKKLSNRLYFGAAQIIVINEEIAKEEGIYTVIDFFLRDAEIRENTDLIISQEKSAREILNSKYTDNNIISYQIDATVKEDKADTLSTVETKLYQTANLLKNQGISLVLPAFKTSQENNKQVTESNGMALFKNDKLIGYLSPEETKFYLFAVNKVKGGILSFNNIAENTQNLSLEIQKNITKYSYSYSEGQITMEIEINTDVFMAEISKPISKSTDTQNKEIEKTAGVLLAKEITDTIKKVQTKYQTDVFGFGNYIYKTNPGLWKQIESDWDSVFANMKVEVIPKITIKSTALTR